MRSRHVAVFIGICWLYACLYLDRQIFGILANSVKYDLHLDDAQLGALTGSAFSIVYALLGLYFGRLADGSDRLRLVRIGAWVWSLASLAGAAATGYSSLIAARAAVAGGEAIATAAAVSLMAELAGPRHRALAASVFFSGAFAGTGIAAIGGGSLLEATRGLGPSVGWRLVLAAAAVPGIVGALALAWVRFPAPASARAPRPDHGGAPLAAAALTAVLIDIALPARAGVPATVALALAVVLWWVRRLRRADADAYRASFGQRPFRVFLAAFAATLFMDFAAGFWLIPFAQRRFDLGAGVAGRDLGALLILGGIAGCLLGGRIADYWHERDPAGRVWTALIAVFAESAAIALAVAQSDYRWYLAAFSVYCVASGGWTGVAAAVGLDLMPQAYRGTCTAAYFLVTTILGPGLGPFVVGLASDSLGSIGLALAASSTAGLAAIAALWHLAAMLRRGPQPRQAPAPGPPEVS